MPDDFVLYVCASSAYRHLVPNRSSRRLVLHVMPIAGLSVRYRPLVGILSARLPCRSPPRLQQTDKPSAGRQTKPTRNLMTDLG